MLPGHTESVSTTITVGTAGVKIVGIGHGTDRPNLTQATTGSSGVMTITVSNVDRKPVLHRIGNRDQRAVSDHRHRGQTDITVKGCVFEQKSKTSMRSRLPESPALPPSVTSKELPLKLPHFSRDCGGAGCWHQHPAHGVPLCQERQGNRVSL